MFEFDFGFSDWGFGNYGYTDYGYTDYGYSDSGYSSWDTYTDSATVNGTSISYIETPSDWGTSISGIFTSDWNSVVGTSAYTNNGYEIWGMSYFDPHGNYLGSVASSFDGSNNTWAITSPDGNVTTNSFPNGSTFSLYSDYSDYLVYGDGE
ncbi:hypothetical protein [Noviherbaspirillum sp.]|uniref:hypothetical protein n=1 Tax=Noviherbaspirillum sp. TaxID=1926288 RepID=UPI002FE24FBB